MLIRRHPIDIIQLIPKRIKESHKGTYGRLLVMAGSTKYTGAASLMVEAALRSGVGIVYAVATHDTAQVIRNRNPEAVVIEAPEQDGGFDKKVVGVIHDAIKEFRIDAIGIGPGIGPLKASHDIYHGIVNILKESQLPTLVDADALSPIYQAESMALLAPNQIVFTPHPKEFLRMTRKDDVIDENKDVLTACKDVKQVIAYKTNTSIVVSEEGIWRSTTGNESLATAGSGDVLSGIISGFLAQGVASLDAAKLGVYLHGLVAEIASQEFGLRSLIASDLCDYIAKGFQEMAQYHG